MIPVIAVIGSPNSGKSTLFNRLSASRKALVADYAGVTRDRLYSLIAIEQHKYILIDTGGFSEDTNEVNQQIHLQIEQAIGEADLCILLVDSSVLPSTEDLTLLERVRKKNKPFKVVLNKSDISHTDHNDFYRYYNDFMTISAAHNRGIDEIKSVITEFFADSIQADQEQHDNLAHDDKVIRIAILGRPNTGKSTLVNSIVGEQRVMALDMPGTTRDVVDINFQRNGQDFCLLDTPGVRRRSRVSHFLEKFSVLKSLQAAQSCDVAIFMFDATEGLVEQDLRLIENLKQISPALVCVINKIDKVDDYSYDQAMRDIDRRQQIFLNSDPIHISALKATGINKLLNRVIEVYRRTQSQWPTSLLNNILQKSLTKQQPPMQGRTRPKLKFMHQQGDSPPKFIIYGNQTKKLTDNYRSYLYRLLREKLELNGVCFRILFKDSVNPYGQDKEKDT